MYTFLGFNSSPTQLSESKEDKRNIFFLLFTRINIHPSSARHIQFDDFTMMFASIEELNNTFKVIKKPFEIEGHHESSAANVYAEL